MVSFRCQTSASVFALQDGLAAVATALSDWFLWACHSVLYLPHLLVRVGLNMQGNYVINNTAI